MKSTFISVLVVYFLSCSLLRAEDVGFLIHEEPQQPDVQLTDFPRDLGNNFKNLFSVKNAALLTGSIFATRFAFKLDDRFENYFEDRNRWGSADGFGNFLGSSIVIASATSTLLLASQFTDDHKFRRMSYSVAQAIVMTSTLTVGFKYTVGRTRPDNSNDLSFLSGHTSNMVAFATIVQKYYGWKAGIPAYALAGFVAASRMERDVHYFSDVVAGAALGYLVARTVTRNEDLSSTSYTFAPITGPDGGAGLGLTIRW